MINVIRRIYAIINHDNMRHNGYQVLFIKGPTGEMLGNNAINFLPGYIIDFILTENLARNHQLSSQPLVEFIATDFAQIIVP